LNLASPEVILPTSAPVVATNTGQIAVAKSLNEGPPVVATNTAQIDVAKSHNEEPPVVATTTAVIDVAKSHNRGPPVVATNTAQIDVARSHNQGPSVVGSHTAQKDVAQGDTLCPAVLDSPEKTLIDELDMKTKLARLKLRLLRRELALKLRKEKEEKQRKDKADTEKAEKELKETQDTQRKEKAEKELKETQDTQRKDEEEKMDNAGSEEDQKERKDKADNAGSAEDQIERKDKEDTQRKYREDKQSQDEEKHRKEDKDENVVKEMDGSARAVKVDNAAKEEDTLKLGECPRGSDDDAGFDMDDAGAEEKDVREPADVTSINLTGIIQNPLAVDATLSSSKTKRRSKLYLRLRLNSHEAGTNNSESKVNVAADRDITDGHHPWNKGSLVCVPGLQSNRVNANKKCYVFGILGASVPSESKTLPCVMQDGTYRAFTYSQFAKGVERWRKESFATRCPVSRLQGWLRDKSAQPSIFKAELADCQQQFLTQQ